MNERLCLCLCLCVVFVVVNSINTIALRMCSCDEGKNNNTTAAAVNNEKLWTWLENSFQFGLAHDCVLALTCTHKWSWLNRHIYYIFNSNKETDELNFVSDCKKCFFRIGEMRAKIKSAENKIDRNSNNTALNVYTTFWERVSGWLLFVYGTH